MKNNLQEQQMPKTWKKNGTKLSHSRTTHANSCWHFWLLRASCKCLSSSFLSVSLVLVVGIKVGGLAATRPMSFKSPSVLLSSMKSCCCIVLCTRSTHFTLMTWSVYTIIVHEWRNQFNGTLDTSKIVASNRSTQMHAWGKMLQNQRMCNLNNRMNKNRCSCTCAPVHS